MHPFVRHEGVAAFAHRGGAANGLENTFAAFRGAVDLGYQFLETDVHKTRDGVIVAFHDEVLDRTTDATGRIAELDYEVVARARVGGVEPIPTLEGLLTEWADVRINIDPKHDAVVEPLAEILRRHDVLDRVCMGSFSDLRLRRLRRLLGPRLCTSMGPAGVARLRLAASGMPSGGYAAECVQVPRVWRGRTLVNQAFVDTAHRYDLAVHVWTIDDPEEMHGLLDLGVDGIMTDRPDVLKEVLVGRNLWRGGHEP